MPRGGGWLVQPVTEKVKSPVAVTIEGVRYVVNNRDAWQMGAALQDAANYGWAIGD